jgi:Ca2+-binding RTX toxin-like protein
VVVLPVGDRAFNVTHTYLDDNPTATPSDLANVSVTLSDDDTGNDSDAQNVTIDNVAPTVSPIAGPTHAVPGQPVVFTASFNDPGTLDTHAIAWQVRDSDGAVVAAGNSLTLNFTPLTLDTYTVELTVTDDDTGAHTVNAQLDATSLFLLEADAQNAGQNILRIGGTSGDDRVNIRKGKEPGSVRVKMKTKGAPGFTLQEYTPSVDGPIDSIAAYTLAGKDRVNVAANLGEMPVELYGGAGDENLKGGRGNDYIDGGPGNDKLKGNRGRDILVGHDGEDRLNGQHDEDILIGGLYVSTEDRDAVLALLQEWTRTDRSYTNRIDHLMNGGIDALNDPHRLNNTTVQNDGLQDRLNGGPDLDWFLGNNADKIKLKLDEVLTNI